MTTATADRRREQPRLAAKTADDQGFTAEPRRHVEGATTAAGGIHGSRVSGCDGRVRGSGVRPGAVPSRTITLFAKCVFFTRQVEEHTFRRARSTTLAFHHEWLRSSPFEDPILAHAVCPHSSLFLLPVESADIVPRPERGSFPIDHDGSQLPPSICLPPS